MDFTRIYTPEQLIYAAGARCKRCGAGFAYPRRPVTAQGVFKMASQWECSALLTGASDKPEQHDPPLPFAFYEVKGENQGSARGFTTRPGGMEAFAAAEQVWEQERQREAEEERDRLGRVVRAAWVAYCQETGDSKPAHLAPWDELSAWDKEADRRIADAVKAALAPGGTSGGSRGQAK